jgi:hypothetical protein
MNDVFVVHDSGRLTLLSDVTADQAAHVVERYPRIHLFTTDKDGNT